MCGIAGLLMPPDGLSGENPAKLASGMADSIRHRGPDAEGQWFDRESGIVLAHRRLAIMDVSPAGAQPMTSASGRWVVIFNGEIYNLETLRAELTAEQSVVWRGHSDTEVMLELFDRVGFAAALPRLIGMFAIAAWDRQTGTLFLARDRIGEKPLYYGWAGKSLAFASELKAFRTIPGWNGKLSRGAITLFMRHNYIPAPLTIYEGVSKLPAGAYIAITAAGVRARQLVVPRTYWSLADVAARGMAQPATGTLAEHASLVESTLRTVIQQQMISDVPLGAFLSGGIDSSLVVALMQQASPRPTKTFTIGFEQAEFNEAEYARAVAKYLGTEHHELVVSARQMLDVVPRLATMYDEPFSDSSQIPTFLVSQLARQHVTVALSGDGGDEMFGGYQRYAYGARLAKRHARMPALVRRMVSGGLRGLPPWSIEAMARVTYPMLPARLRVSQPAVKAAKVANLFSARDAQAIYSGLVSHWSSPERLVLGGQEPGEATILGKTGNDFGGEFVEWMMYADTLTYLPDDIMVKVDRASMAVSLETRAPFLDPRVVELAWKLPLESKLSGGVGKTVLRELLRKFVPDALIDRPKMGFGVPLANWLSGSLRDWAESLLSPTKLAQQGLLDPVMVQTCWKEHLSGRGNCAYLLWDVLMFQQWLESEGVK